MPKKLFKSKIVHFASQFGSTNALCPEKYVDTVTRIPEIVTCKECICLMQPSFKALEAR